MAHYFSYFPKMYYDAVQTRSTSPKLITDFLRRVKVRDGIKNQAVMFDKYRVVTGETPEMVSYRFYDTVDYYWVILLMNNIADRFYGWPLSEQQFLDYLDSKYDNPGAIHHYEIAQTSGPTTSLDNSHTIEVNSTESGATSVSNMEYEQRLQDNKSLIKILHRGYLSEFVDEFARLVGK